MKTTTLDTPANFPAYVREERRKKVVFCIPTVSRPYQICLDSLEASIPIINAAGWDDGAVWKVGCPYISAARSRMLRQALDARADVIVFIDHDLSWLPNDLLKLIETPGDVIAGTYRFKTEREEYMGAIYAALDERPIVRDDGCVKAYAVPAGFLKITRDAVNKFCRAYPELLYGEPCNPCIDLFHHGAHNGVWYGEDYAFSRNWIEKCGDIWIVPDLCVDHYTPTSCYSGNFHRFLMRQEGGSEWQAGQSKANI